MADIYRLDKRGFNSGGTIIQVLSNLTPLGAVAVAATETAVNIAGTAVRRGMVESERKTEVEHKKWDGVFAVTYKPDFREPLTINIRKSEIDRYGLEKDARVVMFDPRRDTMIVTDDGPKTIRTRPSIQVPRSGLFSTVHVVEVPTTKDYSQDYIKYCFAGQTGPDYRSMGGVKAVHIDHQLDTRVPLPLDEIIPAFSQLTAGYYEGFKTQAQLTMVERDQLALDKSLLNTAYAKTRLFLKTVIEEDQSGSASFGAMVTLFQKISADLKESTGLSSPFENHAELNFILESAQFHMDGYRAEKAAVAKAPVVAVTE